MLPTSYIWRCMVYKVLHFTCNHQITTLIQLIIKGTLMRSIELRENERIKCFYTKLYENIIRDFVAHANLKLFAILRHSLAWIGVILSSLSPFIHPLKFKTTQWHFPFIVTCYHQRCGRAIPSPVILSFYIYNAFKWNYEWDGKCKRQHTIQETR